MMPSIRIDDDVWAWLKRQARPFEDTPNSVLRRVANLDEPLSGNPVQGKLRRIDRRTQGNKTPQHEYRQPILDILSQHGGRADRYAVLKELERRMGSRLTTYDRASISSGSIRWQKSAEWEVSTMRQEGLLLPQSASPRGVWCLSTLTPAIEKGENNA